MPPNYNKHADLHTVGSSVYTHNIGNRTNNLPDQSLVNNCSSV